MDDENRITRHPATIMSLWDELWSDEHREPDPLSRYLWRFMVIASAAWFALVLLGALLTIAGVISGRTW